MELDHVLVAVHDLVAAAREIEERHGLVSIEGGSHPGWGTMNRIVPLGDAYLELVAVVDQDEAAQSPFGSWVAAATSTAADLLGWAVRTGDLEQIARRLKLTVSAGSRPGRNGQVVRWRLAGVEQAAVEPCLPFFIEWAPGTRLPGRAPVAHPAGEAHLAQLHLDGDRRRLTSWLGAHDLPITVRKGAPALASVVITASARVITLGPVDRERPPNPAR